MHHLVEKPKQGTVLKQYHYDGSKIVMTLPRDADLGEMLAAFKAFLLAAGFIINPVAELQFVDEDEEVVTKEFIRRAKESL